MALKSKYGASTETSEKRNSRTRNALVLILIAGTIAAEPVLAAGVACLQSNRLVSTRVIDVGTILATDRSGQQYTLRMRGSCAGLDRNAQNLTFRPRTELSCVSAGDRIGYNRPGERTGIAVRGSMQTTCLIDQVSEGAPPGAHG